MHQVGKANKLATVVHGAVAIVLDSDQGPCHINTLITREHYCLVCGGICGWASGCCWCQGYCGVTGVRVTMVPESRVDVSLRQFL